MAVRDFLLPDLGEGLEDAEVVAWKVAEGDTVELNQTLVEVNTAKALVEIPAPWEGVVTKLHAAEGDVVEVGTPLVSIDVEAADGAADQPAEEVGEQAAEAATEEAEGSKPKRQAVLVGYGVEEEDELARARRSRVAKTQGEPDETDAPAAAVATTPPVRKLAKEMGVDLASLTGSGPKGRITREDVERAAEQPEGQPASASTAIAEPE
jgi:pyruvate dehydrogenase E2 component (dihydrolipoamide acetyltransferase)